MSIAPQSLLYMREPPDAKNILMFHIVSVMRYYFLRNKLNERLSI